MLPNYIMQLKLVRMTLFRSTYDLLFRIILEILERINKTQLNELLKFLFTCINVINDQPIQLRN